MPIGSVDISYTVFLFVWLRICPARIKLAASNFAHWFRGVMGSESPILGNFASSEAQNRMNRRTAASIADRRQCLPLTVRSPSVEGTSIYQQYLPKCPWSVWIYGRPPRQTYLLIYRLWRTYLKWPVFMSSGTKNPNWSSVDHGVSWQKR